MKCYIRHSISDIPMFEITEKSPVGIISLTFKTYSNEKATFICFVDATYSFVRACTGSIGV